MGVRHIVSKIEALLELKDNQLSDLFQNNSGAAIRENLLKRKAAGEIYIGSEGCPTFCPKKGCQCS